MIVPLQLQIDANLLEFRGAETNLRAKLSHPIFQMLAKKAIRVESRAKQIATGPPPSAPGEGPAVRTGRLRNSITWRLGEDSEGQYADIGSAVFYAPFLELGTSRMAARPFLRPALAAAKE